MNIKFERKWAGMILIRNADTNCVLGRITHRIRNRKKAACETCGHCETETVVVGFGLSIRGRLFDHNGELVDAGSGGYGGVNIKRLKDAKDRAVELLT